MNIRIGSVLSELAVQRIHDINLETDRHIRVVSSHNNVLDDTCAHIVTTGPNLLDHNRQNYILADVLLNSFRDL